MAHVIQAPGWQPERSRANRPVRTTGLVLSLSLIFAAGVAIYENPQVKQWVDENRRKVALALHNLGDELAPQPISRRPRDASTCEDESPEAVERRRRARQQILERGRVLEEQRRVSRDGQARGISFDDLVNKDGSLKTEDQTRASTTAADNQPEDSGLRHRGAGANAPSSDQPDSSLHSVRPMIDTSSATHENDTTANDHDSRASTPTLPMSPPVPPKPAAYRPQSLLINTDEESSHPSEQLVDFTPTTSPRSAAADLRELDQDSSGQHPAPAEMYMSVNEWAQNQSVQSFHSLPPQSPPLSSPQMADFEVSSVGDSIEHASQAGTEDIDVASSFGEDIVTPSTWTEVGSQVSED